MDDPFHQHTTLFFFFFEIPRVKAFVKENRDMKIL